jgi:hypothetical protein
MSEDENWVCGVSGESINIGDQYQVQVVPPQVEGQNPYNRYVLIAHANLTEEQIAAGVSDGSIVTRTV